MTDAYLRFPDLHGEQIVFTADDDLWLVPATGGLAHRLTSDRMPVRNPRFSPDGKRIAFTSRAGGGNDIYLREPDGTIRRLTWLSDPIAQVCGWADEDHILFTSTHQAAHLRLSYMFTVSLAGEVTRMPWGAAGDAAIAPTGAIAVHTPNFRDSAAWKRYRGGMIAKLWLDPQGAGEWTQVGSTDASCYSLGWLGERLIFSSDMGADPASQAQLWSVDAMGADLRPHTKHTVDDGYVRNPATDGTGVVYHCRGKIYYLPNLAAEPVIVDIRTGLGQPASIVTKPTENVDTVVTDHGGDGSLLAWRGAAVWLTHRAGPARALSDQPGARIREPQVLGRTGRAVWASDAEGEDCLEIAALDAGSKPTRLAHGQLGRVLHLLANPAGDGLAVASHDGRVYYLTLDDGEVREVGRSPEGEATGLAFSPDGRYLVWRSAVGQEGGLGQLVGVDLTSDAESFELTTGQFDDYCPVFTADGKYLAFLSRRTLDPTYDEITFDLSHTQTVRPWLVPLAAEQPAPFGASADGWALSQLAEESAANPKDADATPPSCVLDLDGFAERVLPLPVPAGKIVDLQAAKNGLLWRRAVVVNGELGSGRVGVDAEPPKDQVEHFSFATRKATVVVDGCESFVASGDGERIVVRDKDTWWVQPADRKPEAEDQAKVTIDLSRLRREINPRDEWRQMFDENGRIMAQHFWREDMDGIDWSGVLARYRPLVARLRTHDDFVDLLWETVGELNTSHAYVKPVVGDQARAVGHLGAVLAAHPDGAQIVEILPGESSDPTARSPLRAAGVAAQPGDVIVAVDGRKVADAPHIGQLLQGSVDKVIELTLQRAGQRRRVAVMPMNDEQPLRYHAWVAQKVAYVAEHSAGRLGYVHVPDMMAIGWAEFHRLIHQASLAEGLIVDVRHNSGGHTSQLIIERIARRVLGWGYARHLDTPESYPGQAVRGPVVLVTNAFAGSDGDIVTGAAQNAGIGPVIGERSWGGVVGIDGRFALVDGTGITQPRYAHAFNQQGFGLENHGTDPDIEVVWCPADWESAKDSQLDRAISEALASLEREPAATPPPFDPPKYAR